MRQTFHLVKQNLDKISEYSYLYDMNLRLFNKRHKKMNLWKKTAGRLTLKFILAFILILSFHLSFQILIIYHCFNNVIYMLLHHHALSKFSFIFLFFYPFLDSKLLLSNHNLQKIVFYHFDLMINI